MIKKCKCKKCVYCEQICTTTSVPRINCKKAGKDMVMPAYCSQYKTKEEFNAKTLVERMRNLMDEFWETKNQNGGYVNTKNCTEYPQTKEENK